MTGLLFAALLAASPPPSPEATCPVGPERACVITVAGPGAPRRSKSCTEPPWPSYLTFELGEAMARDENRDGTYETVLAVDLDPKRGCRCVIMKVSFGASLENWLLNVGDSPTNDGHGGDGGTTDYSAEISLATNADGRCQFEVYSATPRRERYVENLLSVDLGRIERRAIELQVCDQDLALVLPGRGQSDPVTLHLRSPNSGRLFALGGQDRTPVLGRQASGDYRVFISLNRVIHDRHGAPSKNRYGRGTREIELYLKP